MGTATTIPKPLAVATSFTFEGVVLPNDQMYALYYNNDDVGVLAGQGQSTKSSFTISNLTDYFYYTNAEGYGVYGFQTGGSLNGSFVAGSSFTGTDTAGTSGGATVIGGFNNSLGTNVITFNATVPPPSTFNFSKPASMGDITGVWLAKSGENQVFPVGQINISGGGTFTGSWPMGNGTCAYTGQVTPDANKNVFSVSIAFQGSGAGDCPLLGQTASGAALITTVSGAPQLLVIAAVPPLPTGTGTGITLVGSR